MSFGFKFEFGFGGIKITLSKMFLSSDNILTISSDGYIEGVK